MPFVGDVGIRLEEDLSTQIVLPLIAKNELHADKTVTRIWSNEQSWNLHRRRCRTLLLQSLSVRHRENSTQHVEC